MSKKDVWRRKKNPGGTSTYKITPQQGDGKENLPRGLMPVSPTSTGGGRENVARANSGEVKLRDKYGPFASIGFIETESEPPSWKKNRRVKTVASLLERFDELQGLDSVLHVIERGDLKIKLQARHPGALRRYREWKKEQDEAW